MTLDKIFKNEYEGALIENKHILSLGYNYDKCNIYYFMCT